MQTFKPTINVRGKLISFEKPLIMGILNITPDSFFAGSRKQTERDICERANEIISQKGEIIDVGAFSTRPGANEVSEEEEMKRLHFGLSLVRKEHPNAVISVDTYRPDVARMAREEYGADIINDISEGGLMGIAGVALPKSDEDIPPMFSMMAKLKIPYILTSVQSELITMLKMAANEMATLHSLGVNDVIFDPGFGFGKALDDNYQILNGLEKLHSLDMPLLVGVSRKSMITRLLNIETSQALNATTALHTIALMKGANILRVHDVAEAAEAVEIVMKLKQ